MRPRVTLLLFLLAPAAAVLWACVGSDEHAATPTPDAGAPQGGRDGACLSNGTCNGGLVCVADRCVAAADASTQGGDDASTDANVAPPDDGGCKPCDDGGCNQIPTTTCIQPMGPGIGSCYGDGETCTTATDCPDAGNTGWVGCAKDPDCDDGNHCCSTAPALACGATFHVAGGSSFSYCAPTCTGPAICSRSADCASGVCLPVTIKMPGGEFFGLLHDSGADFKAGICAN